MRKSLLVSFVSVIALAALGFASCTGTGAAYKAADTVPKKAYVAAEHYASLVKEAAQLAGKPGMPRSAIEAMQAADRAALPVVNKLNNLRKAYTAVKSAENEEALQKAVDNAILLIADLVTAVKQARGD